MVMDPFLRWIYFVDGTSLNSSIKPLHHHKGSSSHTMSTKLKGVFKGLKIISQIFVVKETTPSNDIEIGYPTDVKHVAHIGWESPTGPSSSPSWMGDYKTTTDLSVTGTQSNSSNSRETSWTSQDFEQSRDGSVYSLFSDNASESAPCPDIPKPPKKTRRKKSKSKANSPASSTRSSRSSRSKESLSPTVEDMNNLRAELRFV